MRPQCEYVSFIKYKVIEFLPLIGVVQKWAVIKLLVTVRKDDDDGDDGDDGDDDHDDDDDDYDAIHFALDKLVDFDYFSDS